MDKINDLIDHVHPSNDCKPKRNASEATFTNTPPTLSHADIKWLWRKMAAMYGHKWESSFGMRVDPEGIWLDCLQGLTHSQLNTGIDRVKKSGREWPPGAPEFRALCQPNADSLGLPSEDAAYATFCKVTNAGGQLNWQDAHPAIYHTWRQLDGFEMRRLPYDEHRKRFVNAYRETVKQAAAGFAFPPVPLAIEQTIPPPTEAKRAMQRKERRTGVGKMLAEHWGQ